MRGTTVPPAEDFQRELFSQDFLRQIERLRLLSRKMFSGRIRAERRSRQSGSSLEFADYRNYAPGDDLRSVDWNIYGRLDRLFVKIFEEEEDLHISLLVDASASMRWKPQRERRSKFDQARLLAGALAYIGICNLDRVNVWFFDRKLRADTGFLRGKKSFHTMIDFLAAAPRGEGEETSLARSLGDFASRLKRRGLAIVLSDLFDPGGFEEPLSRLMAQRFDVEVIHVLDPEEAQPGLAGDFDLRDCETEQGQRLTVSPGLLEAYRREFAAFEESVLRFCRRRSVGYSKAWAGEDISALVLRMLREGVVE